MDICYCDHKQRLKNEAFLSNLNMSVYNELLIMNIQWSINCKYMPYVEMTLKQIHFILNVSRLFS